MRNCIAALSMLLASCGYDATYFEGTICSDECPGGLTCCSGVCRLPGPTGTCPIPGDGAVDSPRDDDAAIIDASPATIAFDMGSATTSITGSSQSLTWMHTVGSAPNRVLVVGVSLDWPDPAPGTFAVNSVSYAGVQMQRADTAANSPELTAELWFLFSPPTGAHPVVVNLSGSPGTDKWAIASALSFAGVKNVSPARTMIGVPDNASSVSTTIVTTAPNAWIVDVVAFDNYPLTPPLVPGTAQEGRWYDAEFGVAGAASTRVTTSAGSHTMQWTAPGETNYWAHVVAELSPAGS